MFRRNYSVPLCICAILLLAAVGFACKKQTSPPPPTKQVPLQKPSQPKGKVTIVTGKFKIFVEKQKTKNIYPWGRAKCLLLKIKTKKGKQYSYNLALSVKLGKTVLKLNSSNSCILRAGYGYVFNKQRQYCETHIIFSQTMKDTTYYGYVLATNIFGKKPSTFILHLAYTKNLKIDGPKIQYLLRPIANKITKGKLPTDGKIKNVIGELLQEI